jgi:hypothetical protein
MVASTYLRARSSQASALSQGAFIKSLFPEFPKVLTFSIGFQYILIGRPRFVSD